MLDSSKEHDRCQYLKSDAAQALLHLMLSHPMCNFAAHATVTAALSWQAKVYCRTDIQFNLQLLTPVVKLLLDKHLQPTGRQLHTVRTQQHQAALGFTYVQV